MWYILSHWLKFVGRSLRSDTLVFQNSDKKCTFHQGSSNIYYKLKLFLISRVKFGKVFKQLHIYCRKHIPQNKKNFAIVHNLY